MPIPDEKIEEVRAAADVVDVVGDYVSLKRSGQRYKGLCPFHNEKTPSFSVDPEKNLYYCFGCQAGGDVFKFVQEMEGVGFLESVRMLAERYSIPMPEESNDPEAAGEREAILNALRMAARFFYRQLTQTDRGRPALDYLRDRGFTPKTIKRFGLGFAPDAWDSLLNHAAEKQMEPELLEKAGLVIERNDGSGYYDRYRGRVIFPIFSHIGKVLGFAGRILNPDADQPKYINSPETDVYHKSEVLYGLHQAKRAIRREDEVLMVEGYTDVISLHQAGVQNVVASSGTALTEEQVQTLDRYAKRVLLVYDADEAGGRAAVRGMNLVLEAGMGAYAVELPEGDDPDAFVRREGAEAVREYVGDERIDLPSFLYRRADRAGELETPEDRVETQRTIIESISRIPDPNLRREYVRRTSDVVDVPDSDLFRMLEEELEKREKEAERRKRREKKRREIRRRQQSQGGSPSGGPPQAPHPADDPNADAYGYDGDVDVRDFQSGGYTDDPQGSPPMDAEAAGPPDTDPHEPLPEEKVLLRLMLEHGEPQVEFVLSNMAVNEFTEGPSRDMVQAFIDMWDDDDVRPQRVLEGEFGDDVQSLAASVMMDEYQPSENWARSKNIAVPRFNKEPYEAGASAMTLLKLDRVNEAIEEHRNRMYHADDSDTEAYMPLQKQMMQLHTLRKHIENREFIEWTR